MSRDRRRIAMPTQRRTAIEQIGRRLGAGLALITFVAVVVIIQRDGYGDSSDGTVGIIDAIYYASVSVTTTGFGDISPVTTAARLTDVVLITPARIMFLVLLVGTTMEVLTDQSRQALAVRRWRKRVQNHYIVCGYGSTGRGAIDALEAQGVPSERIVVIDPSPEAVEEATEDGYVTVQGDASSTAVLDAAEIDAAEAVIVTPARDDTAVLITLTARELHPNTTIVAGVREEENLHLLRQSGASSVIHSADTVGRLLGMATTSRPVAHVLDDLLTPGSGLDVFECDAVDRGDGTWGAPPGSRTLAVIRQGDKYEVSDAAPISAGDRLVVLRGS